MEAANPRCSVTSYARVRSDHRQRSFMPDAKTSRRTTAAAALLILLLACIGLAACGGSSSTTSSPTNAAATGTASTGSSTSGTSTSGTSSTGANVPAPPGGGTRLGTLRRDPRMPAEERHHASAADARQRSSWRGRRLPRRRRRGRWATTAQGRDARPVRSGPEEVRRRSWPQARQSLRTEPGVQGGTRQVWGMPAPKRREHIRTQHVGQWPRVRYEGHQHDKPAVQGSHDEVPRDPVGRV